MAEKNEVMGYENDGGIGMESEGGSDSMAMSEKKPPKIIWVKQDPTKKSESPKIVWTKKQ